MADAIRPAIFTIPIGQDMVTALVQNLLGRFGDDPMRMADVLILLPNNRAKAALIEGFVRQAGKGLLLPHMAAVGDLGLDDTLATLVDPLSISGEQPIAPAIEPMARRFLLTGLIRRQRPQLTAVEAMRLAVPLASTFDQLDIEEISPSQINAEHLEGELALHWSSAYQDFIELLAAHNAALAKRGMIGPSARRNALLNRLTLYFASQPPEYPVIAAGVESAAPAVAKLLRQVSLLPNGQVILPMVDLEMAPSAWDALGPHSPKEGEKQRRNEETHPAFHLKLLLDRMNASRDDVAVFNEKYVATKRADTISAIFGNAKGTENWAELPASIKRLPHVRASVANDVAEEARAIAVLIRQALETPEKRVALVTPDRELATRVVAQLLRWEIAVDDSAGLPLSQLPPATLVRGLTDMLADDFGPVALLTVLKHPLVAAGEGRLVWLEHVRALDLVLRGPRTGIGRIAIERAIENVQLPKDSRAALLLWWQRVSEQFAVLDHCTDHGIQKLTGPIVDVAGQLTGGNLWKGEAGRALSQLLEMVGQQDISALSDVTDDALPTLFARLLEGATVRPAYGRHPRVSIWGLLEARMQRADMVICAGLNEGKWPQQPQPDPWLPPRLRHDLALPGLERNIGLSAHDLATALGTDEVVISRSLRDRSGPTVASRFWLRIEAFLGNALCQEKDAVQWARNLDVGESIPAYRQPAPAPSAQQRLVGVSVTQVDTLKSDPYAFYASKILRLRALRAPGSEPDAAWRGTVIHGLLEDWSLLDKSAPDKLLERADAFFADSAMNPILRTIWAPHIRLALEWTANAVRDHADEGRQFLVAEAWGKISLAGVVLTGKVDRIDKSSDGTLAIVDYKTGAPPTKKKVEAGYAMQLGLLGLIAAEGGFEFGKGRPQQFEYWSLNRNKNRGFGASHSAVSTKEDPAETAIQFIAAARSSATDVFSQYITGTTPFTAKLHPEHAIGADYDQLMRFSEWYGRESGDGHG